jgi:hypothetical protein
MTDDIVIRLDQNTADVIEHNKLMKEAAKEIRDLRVANEHQSRMVKYFLDNAVPYIRHHPHCFPWWEHQSNEDCRCGAGEIILSYTDWADYGR